MKIMERERERERGRGRGRERKLPLPTSKHSSDCTYGRNVPLHFMVIYNYYQTCCICYMNIIMVEKSLRILITPPVAWHGARESTDQMYSHLPYRDRGQRSGWTDVRQGAKHVCSVSKTFLIMISDRSDPKGEIRISYGAFPPQGAGRFSPLRCGTGRISTAKKWAWPGLSRTEPYSSRSAPPLGDWESERVPGTAGKFEIDTPSVDWSRVLSAVETWAITELCYTVPSQLHQSRTEPTRTCRWKRGIRYPGILAIFLPFNCLTDRCVVRQYVHQCM